MTVRHRRRREFSSNLSSAEREYKGMNKEEFKQSLDDLTPFLTDELYEKIVNYIVEIITFE